MSMLNDLYIRFDALTVKRGVYKVETIGCVFFRLLLPDKRVHASGALSPG